MKKPILLIFTLILFNTLFAQQNKVYEIKNANWYNGKDFTPGTFWIKDGILLKKAPAQVDSVVDLENAAWIIPPMADANCLSVADNQDASNFIRSYNAEGVFYLNILSNSQKGRAESAKLLGKPQSPDAVFANGGITCSLGEPFWAYEPAAMEIRNLKQIEEKRPMIRTSRKMSGDGYWFIDKKADLKLYWDKIQQQKPQNITIYLLDAANSGGKENKGLTPEIAKAVIKKAHKADLRVFAVVETADDVRLAIKLKADGIANLPGNKWLGQGSLSKYELTESDIQALAKKKMIVIPSFANAQTNAQMNGMNSVSADLLAFQGKTLVALEAAGVNLAIGSNDPARTLRAEFNYWFQLGKLSYPKTLKILCENTPRAIFPNRKIGKLEDGYEANLLVLPSDPTKNILMTRNISFKVKNGKFLTVETK